MFILILLLNQYGWRLFHLSLMEDGYYWVSQRDVPCLMIKAVWYRGPVVQVTMFFAKLYSLHSLTGGGGGN
jgi:hypothetical protein